MGLVEFKNNESRAAPIAAIQPTLVFIGNGLNFSDHMMRTAAAELTQVRVKRIDHHTNLADLVGDATVVAVVVAQCSLDNLATSARAVGTLAPDATFAMAYRDESVPMDIVSAAPEHSELSALSLLPMKMQIDSWLSILRLLVSGESYLPSSVLRAAVPHVEAAAPPPQHDLTEREIEVLSLVSQGMQNKHVAAKMNLSEHTIKLHMHHIIAKLEVRNRTEATVWFLSHPGLTPSK